MDVRVRELVRRNVAIVNFSTVYNFAKNKLPHNYGPKVYIQT